MMTDHKPVLIVAALMLSVLIGAVLWAQMRWPALKPDETLLGRDGDAAFTMHIFAPHASIGNAPIVVYAPGWGGLSQAHDVLQRAIADEGFLVVALDDVDFDTLSSGSEAWPRREEFSLSNAAGVEKTKVLGAARVNLQARHILSAVMHVANHPSWRERVDARRVAVVGHSIGGATGAEASLMDARIGAVANLDGWLFGEAAKKPLRCAYLWMLSKESLPHLYARDDPVERWRQADLAIHARFADVRDVEWVVAKRTLHKDLARVPRGWRRLLPSQQVRNDRQAQIETVIAFLRRWRDGTDHPDTAAGGDIESVNEKALSGVSMHSEP